MPEVAEISTLNMLYREPTMRQTDAQDCDQNMIMTTHRCGHEECAVTDAHPLTSVANNFCIPTPVTSQTIAEYAEAQNQGPQGQATARKLYEI